ncbi:MAG: acetolactate synthase large subunit [Candidatus Gracilibacteria bacterium]|nr:acetolactate synthase large subunit [Candidatus Gracilibacteria bacterium]
MKASDLFIKCLENEGVEYIYGVPGEENLDMLESIRNSKIKLILTRNEQTAVFMAATYGRLTGKTGVAIATLGPGATNMLTGVAYAQLGGMPVIVITGQKPIKKSKQGQFQIIDVVSMMKPVTKLSTSIVNGSRIPSTIRNAFKLAEAERPGAVAIELPEDIAEEMVEDTFVPLEVEKIRRPVIDEKMLEILKNKIEKAKCPIILVGAGANRKRISKYLEKFITKNNIPFFSSQMGKGVVDERLEQYLGTAALTEKDYIHDAIKKADLILSVGYDVIEKPTNILGPNGTETIHINFYPATIDDVYFPKLEVVGDIGNIFWQLDEIDLDNKNWDFSEIYKINTENKKKIEANLDLEKDSDTMFPRKLANNLREVLKSDDILALDNGLYKVWLARNYPAYETNTILLDNALATMGAGLASAMSAKILNPNKNVVCVTGDGGLVMNLGDLETAVRLNLDITIVVLNNSAYGMIKWKQKNAGFGDFGLDFGNPDFVKLALSFGAKGYKVENKSDFKGILEKTLSEKGIKIIDLAFDYPEKIS